MEPDALSVPVRPRGTGAAVVAAPGGASRSLATARALFPEGLSAISRAARCYLLVQRGSIDLPLAPRVTEAITIDPHQPIEAAARDALRECLDQIATNLVVVEKLDDIGGPHQLRNGLRRLRTAVSAFAPALDCKEAARLGGEALWLGRQIGILRDLDVAANSVLGQAESNFSEPTLRYLAHRLSQMAQARRQHLRTVLAGPRARGFLIDLADFVDTLCREVRPYPLGDVPSVGRLADVAISLRWEAVRARACWLDRPDAALHHKLRKQIRKLRHTVQLFHSLYSAAAVEPFLSCLRDIQAALGDLSDAEMMRAILSDIEGTYAGDRPMERVIAEVVRTNATNAERSLAAAKALLSDLTDTEAFWERVI
jgi:CHAD domain-containing protein